MGSVFDKAAELAASNTVTTTASSTGIAMPVRFLPTCDWVICVTAIKATATDETYTFSLEVSNLVGGTYTKIAEHVWPRGHGVGRMHVPINGDMSSFQDTDSAFVRITATNGGTLPSISFQSFLTKPSNKAGLGARQGDIVSFP